MKKMFVLTLVVLLLVTNAHTIYGSDTNSKDSIKVLVDESRVFTIDPVIQELLIGEIPFFEFFDWSYSFNNILEPWGFGFARLWLDQEVSLSIREKGKLRYSLLKDYDVLVIASFGETYSSAEVDAIKEFVENGGGLLLLGDPEYPNNSVSRAFDVQFYSESVVIADNAAESFLGDNHAFYITETTKHPITKGIKQIALNFGIPILSYESGEILVKTGKDSWADKVDERLGSREDDEEPGPFDILLAMETGRGRAIFFGSSMSFWNAVIFQPDQENLDLLINAVKWLGEPGGPYKQYQSINEQGQQVLSEAVSLYKEYQFSQAKQKFEEAIRVFEESNEIYPNADADAGIEKAEGYIAKCEIGISADETFDRAQELFNKREYENAIDEYEKARSLYQQVGYIERIYECTAKVDESNEWISLREKAVSLFQEGEEAFSAATSTFSSSGYEAARLLFEQSKTKWEEYNDPDQVVLCEEKINACNREIARTKRNVIIVVLAGIGGTIGFVLIVLFMFKRKTEKVQNSVDHLQVEEATEEEKGNTLDVLDDRDTIEDVKRGKSEVIEADLYSR